MRRRSTCEQASVVSCPERNRPRRWGNRLYLATLSAAEADGAANRYARRRRQTTETVRQGLDGSSAWIAPASDRASGSSSVALVAPTATARRRQIILPLLRLQTPQVDILDRLTLRVADHADPRDGGSNPLQRVGGVLTLLAFEQILQPEEEVADFRREGDDRLGGRGERIVAELIQRHRVTSEVEAESNLECAARREE